MTPLLVPALPLVLATAPVAAAEAGPRDGIPAAASGITGRCALTATVKQFSGAVLADFP